MEFQHFLHHHKLSSVEFEENNMPLCIPGCMDIVAGPAYSCRECPSFVMHKSCAELPPQVQKGTFHPHPFRFNMMDVFVCGACRRLTASIINYKCMYCEFKLDFKCAMSVFCNDENEIAKHDEKARQGTTIRHFCHLHQLNRCVFSSWMILSEIQIFEWIWGSSKLKCVACKHEIQGTLYICISCQFVIHESCMNELPRQIQRSPFHPHHFLLPRPFLQESDASRQVPCYACNEKVQGFSFYCNECDANFHHSCAKYLTRAVKHNCHPHDLLQLGKNIIHNLSCDACGEGCNDSCFSCKKCDFNIHPRCIPLPSSFTHKRHLHSLALVSSFVEDDSGDYCCDMCETERNPELQVYYCEECNYIAHIDCVLSEVLESTTKMLFDPQRKEESSDNQCPKMEGRVHQETLQKDSFHPHPLIFEEFEQLYVCDECEELCINSTYSCKLCSFNLCGRCATLDNEIQQVKKTKTIISHFSHFGQLTRCKVDILQRDPEFKKTCMTCRQRLCGITYACIDCEFFLHESCLKNMLEEVQSSSFHPQHPLRTFAMMNYINPICSACREIIKGPVFSCIPCSVVMHYSCSKYQFREVKHGCHADHHLLHLGKGLFGDESPQCNACDQACKNTLWGCLECRFYRHLECIPLPSVVKHKRHLHPLVLTTSVIEDDSGDYCCDACETQRNPEHDVYHCKECNYISHIDCIISEVELPEQILQYLTPRPKGKN